MATIGSVVWGVRDIPRAIEFWAAALDYELLRPPDDDWAVLQPHEGQEGIQLSLKLTNSDGPHRHHLDLFSDDQAADVERFLELGADPVDWEYEADADYVVLSDPDGNRFCIVQV
jgi:catechol 2,3-dioxygenase-like lactoylglutathione lyase family enzyme